MILCPFPKSVRATLKRRCAPAHTVPQYFQNQASSHTSKWLEHAPFRAHHPAEILCALAKCLFVLCQLPFSSASAQPFSQDTVLQCSFYQAFSTKRISDY